MPTFLKYLLYYEGVKRYNRSILICSGAKWNNKRKTGNTAVNRWKKIGLIVNKDRDQDLIQTKHVTGRLLEKGFEVFTGILEEGYKFNPPDSGDNIFTQCDLIICVGGDGTFLKTAREAYPHKKPILGINKGSVGFLAEVEIREIDTAVERIAGGFVTIQPRMVLEVSVIRNQKVVFKDVAINDAVVSRMPMARILRLKVRLDSQFVDSFPGDGIIVSTPTGSTGYTLSAGGPIVQQDMRMFIISPICPHILYSRSFIASEDKKVFVELEEGSFPRAMLTLDGQIGFELEGGDKVMVATAPENVLFASVCPTNFYEVLRDKIHNSI